MDSRLSCFLKNDCQAKDTAETKAKCVASLIDYKFVKEDAAVAIARSRKMAVVHLAGDQASLKRFAAADRIQTLVQNYAECRGANQCSPNQGLVERWRCVNTLAQHILQR